MIRYPPADEPLCEVLESHEAADDGPVHGPTFELWLRVWEAVEGLERGETWEQEGEPGAFGGRFQ